MNHEQRYTLSSKQSIDILHKIIENKELRFEYNYENHKIIFTDELFNPIFTFRVPINIPTLDKFKENANLETKYIIALIQSGSASIGYFEGVKNIHHKVFSAYMVRKKQGKSQIKHLKTKGKSRAGSRIRLSKTLLFFEDINKRLTDHCIQYPIDRIAFSCSKILIPYLYNSKEPCPFEKKDERIYKIPKHLNTPNYEVMMNIAKFLHRGEFFIENKDSTEKVIELLKSINYSFKGKESM